MNYYVKYNNQTMGPFAEEQIINLLQQGRFDASVCFSNDMVSWRPAREVSSFKDIQLRPAPVSQQFNVQPPQDEQSRSYALAYFGGFCLVAILVFAVVVIGILKDDIKHQKKTVAETVPIENVTSGKGTLQNVFEHKKSAVALVTITFQMQNGDWVSKPIGTAFAISNNRFVTNSHVAYGIKNKPDEFYRQLFSGVLNDILLKEAQNDRMTLEAYKEKIGKHGIDQLWENIVSYYKENGLKVRDIEVRLSSSNGKRFVVKNIQVHPDYHYQSGSGEYDVAILEIDGKTNCYFELASKKELFALKAGERVGSAGFPMEGIGNPRNVAGDTNINNPEAIYASGDIKRITDFDYKDAGPENNRNITHSIPGAGGGSGSPIFIVNGKVIAVFWGVSNFGNLGSGRITNATLQNYAVRIDQLENVKNSHVYTWEEWINDPLKNNH